LKKEIKEDTRRWKDCPCSWIRKISTVKMSTLLKAIYRFKLVLKFIWKPKRPWIDKATPSKKSNIRGITIPHFKLYYRVIVTKTCGIGKKTDV
jgi:hypothetical protein